MAAINLNPYSNGMENIPDISNMAVLIRNIAVSIRTSETQTDEIILHKDTYYAKSVETQTEGDMEEDTKTYCSVALQTDNFLEWRGKSHDDNSEVLIGQFLHEDCNFGDVGRFTQDTCSSAIEEIKEEDNGCYDDDNSDILDTDGSKIEIEIVNDNEDEENMVFKNLGDKFEPKNKQLPKIPKFTLINNPNYKNGVEGMPVSENHTYIKDSGRKNRHESRHLSENQANINRSVVQNTTLDLIEKKLTVQSNNTKKHQTHVLKFPNKSTTVDESAVMSAVWQQIVHVGREEEFQLKNKKLGTTSPSKVAPLDQNNFKNQTGGSKKGKGKKLSTGKHVKKSKLSVIEKNRIISDEQNIRVDEKESAKDIIDNPANSSDCPEKIPNNNLRKEKNNNRELVLMPGSSEGELVVSLQSKVCETGKAKNSSESLTFQAENESEIDHSYSLSCKSALHKNSVCDEFDSSEDDIDDYQDDDQDIQTEQIITPTKSQSKKITAFKQIKASLSEEKQKTTKKISESVVKTHVESSISIKDCSVSLTRIEQNIFKNNVTGVSKHFAESQNKAQVSSTPSGEEISSESKPNNSLQNTVNHPHRTRSRIQLTKAEFLEKHRALGITPKRKQEDDPEVLNKKKVKINVKLVKMVNNETERSNLKKETLICPVCSKYVASDYKMMIHLRKHERKKTYKCHICHQKFPGHDGLHRHMALHNRTPNYECRKCRRPFFDQFGLNLHMVSHSRVMLSCPYCAKQYKGKNGLHSHISQMHNVYSKMSVINCEDMSETGKNKYSTRTKTGSIDIINYRDKLDISAKKLKGPKMDVQKPEQEDLDLHVESEVNDEIESNMDDILQKVIDNGKESETFEITQNSKASQTPVNKEFNETVTGDTDTVSNVRNNSVTKQMKVKSKLDSTDLITGQTVDKKEVTTPFNLLNSISGQKKGRPKSENVKSSVSAPKKVSAAKVEHYVMNGLDGDIEPKCDGCGEVFYNVDYLIDHLNKYKNAKIRHTCEKCKKVFPRSKNLRRHQKSCLNKKPRPRKNFVEDGETPCPTCGKVLKSRIGMKVHYRNIHSGKPRKYQPQTCQLCGLVLARKTNLNIHMQIHRGIKNYLCAICGRRFRLKITMETHMRVHTGEKKIPKYPCDICGRMFSTSYNKKIHRMSHTGEKPFKCNICGHQFRTNAFLNTHKRNVHNEVIPNSNTDFISYKQYFSKHCLKESDFMSKERNFVSKGGHLDSFGNSVSELNSLESLDVLKDNQIVALVTDGSKDKHLVSLIDGSKYDNLVSLVDGMSTENSQIGVGDDGSIYQYVVIENPQQSEEADSFRIEEGSLEFEEETECAVITIMESNKL